MCKYKKKISAKCRERQARQIIKSEPMRPKSMGPKFYQKMNFKKGFCDSFFKRNNHIDTPFYKIIIGYLYVNNINNRHFLIQFRSH